MIVRLIARDCWTEELDGFSRQHEGWLVSIKTRMADGTVAVDARDLPLQGVSSVSLDTSDIAVTVGDARNHLTHDVRDATAVRIDLTGDTADRAIVIDAKDGSTTILEFRSPIRVEEVDGLAASQRE